VPAITAGPVSDKDITSTFKIPEKSSSAMQEGEWRIYFISVGEFEKGSWNFTAYYDKIKKDYTAYKQDCGRADTFYQKVYKMSDEEKQHKGCTINGTYQEEYCFKTVSNNPRCSALIPYNLEDLNGLDHGQLTFSAYYNSYMWGINRADTYNHFELSYCDVKNSSCTFKISKTSLPYNPYVAVLEKLNSTSEIYYSGKLNLEGANLFYNETLFYCSEAGCDVNIDMTLTPLSFEVREPHTFLLEFDKRYEIPASQNQPQNTAADQGGNFFSKLISWVKSLFRRTTSLLK
jgi:hypothetical protein